MSPVEYAKAVAVDLRSAVRDGDDLRVRRVLENALALHAEAVRHATLVEVADQLNLAADQRVESIRAHGELADRGEDGEELALAQWACIRLTEVIARECKAPLAQVATDVANELEQAQRRQEAGLPL